MSADGIPYCIAIIILFIPVSMFIGANREKKKREELSNKEHKRLTTCSICEKSNYGLNIKTYTRTWEPQTVYEDRKTDTYVRYTVTCKNCDVEIGEFSRNTSAIFKHNSYGDLLAEITAENKGCNEQALRFSGYFLAIWLYGGLFFALIFRFAGISFFGFP